MGGRHSTGNSQLKKNRRSVERVTGKLIFTNGQCMGK